MTWLFVIALGIFVFEMPRSKCLLSLYCVPCHSNCTHDGSGSVHTYIWISRKNGTALAHFSDLLIQYRLQSVRESLSLFSMRILSNDRWEFLANRKNKSSVSFRWWLFLSRTFFFHRKTHTGLIIADDWRVSLRSTRLFGLLARFGFHSAEIRATIRAKFNWFRRYVSGFLAYFSH